mgnify:CR=1 FL=1
MATIKNYEITGLEEEMLGILRETKSDYYNDQYFRLKSVLLKFLLPLFVKTEQLISVTRNFYPGQYPEPPEPSTSYPPLKKASG